MVPALCALLSAMPCTAQHAAAVDGAPIWLGEYVPGAYPTRLPSGLPFGDGKDPPGPGVRVAQPMSALRPWGYLQDGRFVSAGAPLGLEAMREYGKALQRCAGGAQDRQASCRLAVAEGARGFRQSGLARAIWYCGAWRIEVRDATASFQDSQDGAPVDATVFDLSLATTATDCGKTRAAGFSGDPAVPVSTSPTTSVQAFQPLEDLMSAGQVAALRAQFWPLARRALVEKTRAQLANASTRAIYDQQCRQPGLSGRDVTFQPIADISKASLDDYANSGADVARTWQAAPVDGKRRLIFVSLWANVMLPGATKGACPATVRASAWIMDDGTAGGRLLRGPATTVSQPDVLLHVEDGIYVVNHVDGGIDLGMAMSDETPVPKLSIEQLTPEGLSRLGYPGYGMGNPRPAEGLPLGYAH